MKIPKIRKLPSGNYFCCVRVGGRTYSITRTTEREVKREAQLIKAQHAGEKRQEAADPTLRQLIRRYIDRYESVLSPSTVRAYESILRHRFSAYKDIPVSGVDWQKLINDELREVGEKTVKNSVALAAAAAKDAKIAVPDFKTPTPPVKEIPFLQPDEIPRFVEAARGDPQEMAALLLLHGLRLSEVLALTPDSIDRKKQTITVSGSVVRGKDGLTKKPQNKNKTSSRTVPVIIPRIFDLPLRFEHPNAIRKRVNQICRRAGVTVVGCHGLRHSFASLAYDRGLTDQEIMDIGGWSNPATMRGIYIRVSEARRKASAEKLRAFFANENANENREA